MNKLIRERQSEKSQSDIRSNKSLKQNQSQSNFGKSSSKDNQSSLQIVKSQKQAMQERKQEIESGIIINCLFSFIKKVKVIPTILREDLETRYKKYDSMDQNIYYPFYPDINFQVMTKQGRENVKQLLKYLENIQTMQTHETISQTNVVWSRQLHQAAMKRAESIQKADLHGQSMDVGQLVNQFGYWRIYLSEIIVYGFIDPKQLLIEAFLQDGSPTKKNREQFFHQKGKYVGIGIAKHDIYRVVVVIIFAGDIRRPIQIFGSQRSVNSKCQCSIF